MHVNLVLPAVARFPVGGYKVAYQFANGLAGRGHQVQIVHPFGARSNNREFWLASIHHAAGAEGALERLIPWFTFGPGVHVILVPWIGRRWMPDADMTVLTAWQTSRRSFSARHGGLVQLVYDYEFWLTAPESTRARIARALSRPDVVQIATSRAVLGMLREMRPGTNPATITAGLDLDVFRCETEQDDREELVVFPLRPEPHKGVGDAFEVANLVQRRRPNARFACFGEARNVSVPDNVTALGRLSTADLVALYNRCSVFVLPSRAEGWGLPAAEAMACGAAVVCTANGGSEDFAQHRRTALVTRPGDVDALSSAVLELLEDRGLRSSISREGRLRAQQMTWVSATNALEDLLVERWSAA